MKISKKLLLVLIIGSIVPPTYFRIKQWLNGEFNSYYEFFESLLFYSLISLVVTLSISWVVLSILHWLNRRLPWTDNILKRLLAEISLTLPISLFLGFIFGNITFLLVKEDGVVYKELIFSYLTISLIMNFVLVAISDWFYFFDRWKLSLVQNQKTLTDNEVLQREKIAAQYEALKNQINPHFLFNSLNVLSSIVHTDPDKAEMFIDEFASLYRYILENNENETITLSEEIDVAKSYCFLQEIRFGKAVQFSFEGFEKVDTKLHAFPLSVQTLLENAVKHNIASDEMPLHITIILAGNQVIIQNNLQLRKNQEPSTGIGTTNLIMRYKPYKLVPRFVKTADHYTATLPLLDTPNQNRQND